MISKAAALRFLADNVGRTFQTSQIRAADGQEWDPGPRTLARKGAHGFTLNGSTVQLSPNHTVTELTADALTVEWRTADGALIHTTTYTLTT